MVYQHKQLRINRARFTAVKYNLGAIQNRIAKKML